MEDMQFISCVRFSLQLIIVEAFFILGWNRKHHFLLRLLTSFAVYFVFVSLLFRLFVSIPGGNPIIYTLYYMSMFFLTLAGMRYCFQVKAKEILFAGICAYATQHIAFAVSMMIQEITGIVLSPVPDFLFFRFLPYLLISLFVYFVLVRRYEGKSELKDRDSRMLVLAFVILLTAIFISVLVDNKMFQGEPGILRNVFCKLYAVLCCAMAIFAAYNLTRQNWILHENEIMETMLHNLKEQQKLSRENINIINIKCHDLKYRISQISKIDDAGEQKEYIETIKEAVAIYDNIYQTGNDILDLVLTEKSLLCDEYRIKMSCMIEGSIMNFINTTDLYALFGNLLDNAIESVMKEVDEEKRIISILVAKKPQGCHIHVDNYCGEQLTFEDGLPVTSKKDKAYHGFGVKSIKYIVDKYKGDVLMQAAEQRFQVDILFYM
ncbi:ATP-binding protein [uncultured Robinsoniella sp.]|uniref:ATP-binding protein n=1 Tax=uncultured Robinsoniella sp. TaxID=904190 RepID=UPI00374F6D7D